VEDPGRPRAAAAVAGAARRLNTAVVEALLAAGLAPVAVPGSVLARCRGGELAALRADIVSGMLASGWLPVVYGDVAPDELWGAAIASTEPLLAGLAEALGAERIVLATDVAGVFDQDPHVVPGARPLARLTPGDLAAGRLALGGSRPGVTDVTGGMASKVERMLALVQRRPGLSVRIVSGLEPGTLARALSGDPGAGGTLLVSDDR
jgi:isopentenyl phosphate kinase